MAPQSLILRQCFQEAASAAGAALARCIDQIVAALQLAETKSMKMAERDELATAWRDLLKHKNNWSADYPAQLLRAFEAAPTVSANATAHALATARTMSSGPSGFAELSLVDDTELLQAIESSRLLQSLLPTVEQPLARLDALVSSAQGLQTVSPELNPMRPEVFAQTLRTLIGTVPAEPTVASMWLRMLAEPLAPELAKIYAHVAQLLDAAHVQAAGYRVLQTPAGSKPGADRGAASRRGDLEGPGTGSGSLGGQSGQGGHSGRGGMGETGRGSLSAAAPLDDDVVASDDIPYADLAGYEIGDALFQDFLYHGGSNAQARLAPSYYASVEEELATLRASPEPPPESAPQGLPSQRQAEYQATPAVDRPARLVDVLSQLSSQLWGVYGRARERSLVRSELKKDATRVGQVLGLEVVRKLVNQVAQDPRLLVPVREAIVALEPSLLRLAMVDPRFFSDERHPGRLLMERVAQRSFRFNDEFSAEFNSFFTPVHAAFNDLNQQRDIQSPEPFSAALAQLEALWGSEDTQESAQREEALRAMRFAEQRQATADQIAYDLSTRSDLEKVPGAVLDFLFGSWALVMAQAKLTDTRNQIDPKGYGSVVSQLVWSSKIDFTLNQPAKLIEMIPGLLRQLNEGLDSLGQDPAERQTFFAALEKLHRPVLELRRATRERVAQETARLMADPAVQPASPEQRVAKAAEQPWLAPREIGSAGFDKEAAVGGDSGAVPLPPATSAPAGADNATPGDAEVDDQMQELMSALGTAGVATTPSDTDTSPDAAAVLQSLHIGHWVDLYSKGHWLRAQLIWASTRGTLYMFESHGGQPHSMTRRSCEKLVRERLLRPVQSQGVIDQALDALSQETAAEH